MDLWWPSVWIASYFSLREWGKFHRYLMPCQDEFLHSPGPEIYPHTRAAKEVLLFRAKCGGPTTFRSRLNRDSVLDLTRDNGHLTQLLQTLDPLFENETFLLLLSVDDEVDVLRSRERIWTQGNLVQPLDATWYGVDSLQCNFVVILGVLPQYLHQFLRCQFPFQFRFAFLFDGVRRSSLFLFEIFPSLRLIDVHVPFTLFWADVAVATGIHEPASGRASGFFAVIRNATRLMWRSTCDVIFMSSWSPSKVTSSCLLSFNSCFVNDRDFVFMVASTEKNFWKFSIPILQKKRLNLSTVFPADSWPEQKKPELSNLWWRGSTVSGFVG